jgi:hypothetical protein
MRSYFNGYTYGTEGYLHRDQNLPVDNYAQETILVYCNSEWKPDWAGETQFFSEDRKEIVYSTLPWPNKIICFDSSIPHVARSVSRSYFGLRTILAFKTTRYKINEQECIDYIKAQTENIPHSRVTFFEHLYNTFLILKNIGAPEDVCAAGLFHAVYGTDYFQHNLTVNRETVRNLIGPYAEDLVFTFCTMQNRTPSIIENAQSGNHKDYFLACIEYANLVEQMPRFDNLGPRVDKLKRVILSYGFHHSS